MTNRLANATSPYLLQHADNPVDWYEWGADAFALARDRDVPVFLSVGYSACHWCHVMAHESFEDDEMAAYLNDNFVSVKVDREERPDVDAVYMEATQAMTGQGGWPMSCFLTSDGKPFYCGTYFPARPRYGMPSFRQLADAITSAWRDRRDELAEAAADVARRLGGTGRLITSGEPVDDPTADALRGLSASYDREYGGFGGAPKFPPSMVCDFLLRHAMRTGDDTALTMATGTLEAMARGGIYDQLGGGFARYSVDGAWLVPHFEKMLYDNALLLRVYARWLTQTGSALAARVTRQTADFLVGELRTVEGGFASAIDADSEGVEGKFYVWTPEELDAVLGAEDGARAASMFAVTTPGNFEHGSSTLRLPVEPAADSGYESLRARLFAHRESRVRPGRDDKVVAGWNGLAIAALVETAIACDEPRYLDAAVDAAELLLAVHLDDDGRLARVSRDGRVGQPAGTLEDHAAVATALFTLSAATGDQRWFGVGRRLVDVVLAHFGDGDGGFFDSADDAESLFKRPQDPTDNAAPSGQALTAEALVTLAALTGDATYSTAASTLLDRLVPFAARAPRFAGHLLSVREAVELGPPEVAVVGADGPGRRDLLRIAFEALGRGAAVASGAVDRDGTGDGGSGSANDRSRPALLDLRAPVDGRPTGYVCRHFVCERPVTDPESLAALLRPVAARR
jgi:uncharacterized protein YyaL (SSP411 family)